MAEIGNGLIVLDPKESITQRREQFKRIALEDSNVVKETKIENLRMKNSEKKDEFELRIEETIDWGNYDVGKLIDKMVKFGGILNAVKLYPYQIEFQRRVFESILKNDGAEITALFARQSGKTETIAQTANVLMVLLPVLAHVFPQLERFKRGFRIGLFAPTAEQAYTTHERMDSNINGDEAYEILSDSEINAEKRYSGGILSIQGDSFTSVCRLQSANKRAKIESKTYDMIILEEAQDLDDYIIEKSIIPMTAATNGTIIRVGTPIPQVCNFYDVIRRNKSGREKNHFEYNYRTVIKYNPLYKKHIQKQIEMKGRESDAFKMSYELIWLIEKGVALTNQQFEEYLKNSSLKYQYSAEEGDTVVAGLDLGRVNDPSVLTIAKVSDFQQIYNPLAEQSETKCKKTILNWVEYELETPWEVQFRSILQHILAYNIKVLVVDSTGVGDAIYERLQFALEGSDVEIIGLKYSVQSGNMLAVLFYEELFKRRIQVPFHPAVRKTRRFKNFLNQFLNCEKYFIGQNMKLANINGKEHDDYVNSLLLAIYAAERVEEGIVEMNQGSIIRGRTISKRSDFKRKIRGATWSKK